MNACQTTASLSFARSLNLDLDLSSFLLFFLFKNLRAQYLFNCPESYSRLSLEHRCRPSAALRACFATSVSPSRGLGGLGGLLMRLRADGHGELRLVGPRGTRETAGSLRNLLRWRHPTVFVDEVVSSWCSSSSCGGGGSKGEDAAVVEVIPPPKAKTPSPPSLLRSVYRDDQIDVVAAWTDENECAIPGWMRTAKEDSSSSSSSSDDDSDDNSTSSDNDDDSSSSSSSSSSDSEEPSPSFAFRDPLPPLERDYELCHGGPSPLYAEAERGDGGKNAPSSSSSPSFPSIWAFSIHIPRAGSTLLVIDCATAEAFERARRHPLSRWLLSLEKRPREEKGNGGKSTPSTSNDRNVSAIFHLTRAAVAETPEYREWARRIAGAAVEEEEAEEKDEARPPRSVLASLVDLDEVSSHSSSSSSSSYLGHLSSARTLTRLSIVDPVIFPLPRAIVPPASSPSRSGNAPPSPPPSSSSSSSSSYPGRLMLRVDFPAKPGSSAVVDESECVSPFDPEAIVEAMTTKKGGIGGNGEEEAAAAAAAAAATAAAEREAKRPKKQDDFFSPAVAQPSASNKEAAAALRARLKPSNNDDREKAAAAAATTQAAALAQRPPAHSSSGPPPSSLNDNTNNLPTLFFLGTGSAEPSAHRGASGMFLDVPGSCSGILFDAGEGTAGALAKAWRNHRASDGGSGGGDDDEDKNDDQNRHSLLLLPPSLRAVWLSHRHADHVLGLLGVLEARREGMMTQNRGIPAPPLLVVGPHSVGRWLSEAAHAAGWNDHDSNPPPLYRFASASSLYPRHDPEGARRELETLLGLEAWVPVRADHCSDAHGAVLWSRKISNSSSSCSSSPSWSLAVSGDTVPTSYFSRAAQGVDVLVHEATFASGESGEEHAARKKHSTVAGAMGVAAASFAKQTILTHFSQRYPGLPPDALEAPGQWDAARAVAAADGMTVRFGEGLKRLEGLTGRTVDALGDEDEHRDGAEDAAEKSALAGNEDSEDGDGDACCCGA